jgi:glycosyltransferase involved in cell wall biosynthesis
MAPAGEPPAPLVTVVVATFDSRATLACALESVRRQTFTDYEVWVVGDACTDGSDAAVSALADARFRWLNLARNSGSQAGPNDEGARRARGRYVAYLGHDDLWFPWHLATLVEAAQRETAGVVHALGVLLGPDGRLQASGPPPRGVSYRGHFVPPTNWLVERRLLEAVGGWGRPEALPRPVDVELLDRLAASGASIVCAPRLTTIKFPSARWRAYASDAPRPQIAMAEALSRDPVALCERLLSEIAAEHARATFPTWAPPPRHAWRQARAAIRRAGAATLHACESWPIVSTLQRWRFQRIRRANRKVRGLTP